MRKSLLVLTAIAGTVAVAVAAAAALGARPSVGPCSATVPTGNFASFRTQASDGNCLQGYAWAPDAKPDGKPALAAVVVVHGLYDHARRYAALAQALNTAGVAVLAQDHRGHGASGGARQRVDSIDQLVGDVTLALQEAARRHPGVPLFVYGHSMGGTVATHVAARNAQPLAGVIISSAALKLPASAGAGQLAVVGTLSTLAPGLPLEAINEANVVRDAGARAALAADTVIDRNKVPARSVATVLDGIATIQPRMATIQPPLLVLHGGADTVTEAAGSRELASRNKGATLKIYDAALHDLLHELEGPVVTQDIVAFVTARLAGGK